MLITQKQTNKLRFSLTFVTLHHFIHRFTIMMMMMKIWIEKKFSKQQSSCFIFDSFFLSWSLMMVMHLWFHMRKREKLQNFVLHECIDIYTHLKHGDGCCFLVVDDGNINIQLLNIGHSTHYRIVNSIFKNFLLNNNKIFSC